MLIASLCWRDEKDGETLAALLCWNKTFSLLLIIDFLLNPSYRTGIVLSQFNKRNSLCQVWFFRCLNMPLCTWL